MSLFRLDYCDTNGKATGPVLGSHIGLVATGDVLCSHMTTARTRAIQAANRAECDVLVTRIVGGGRMKPSIIIDRHGKGKRPPGTKTPSGPDCRAGSGRACFCVNCRAARR